MSQCGMISDAWNDTNRAAAGHIRELEVGFVDGCSAPPYACSIDSCGRRRV
jgi:hypothetical protein